MKVKVLRNGSSKDPSIADLKEGETIEVSEERARQLIEKGLVEPVSK